MSERTTDQIELTEAHDDDVIDIVDVSDLTDHPTGSSKQIKKKNYLKDTIRQIPGLEGYAWIKGKDNTTGEPEVGELFIGAGDYFNNDTVVLKLLELPIEDESDFKVLINLGQ